MSAHAKKSPSAADSWMVCLGYLNAIEGLPNITNEAAAEGTAAHSISDLCLTTGMDAIDFVGMKTHVTCEETGNVFSFEWNEYDAELLQEGIDEIRALEGKFFGEYRVDLSKWLGPDQFGTLDRGIVTDDLVIINDLKWGRGIPVSPVQNKQLMLYAAGFWWNVARHISKATRIKIIIDQPRHAGGGGEWELSLEDLLKFADEAGEASRRTDAPDAPRVASEKGCMFCPRRQAPGGCETHDDYVIDILGLQFDDVDIDIENDTPPAFERNVTPERRSYLVRHTPIITKWLDDLKADCLSRALAGEETPGLKPVPGRYPPRKWNDDEKAELTFVPLIGGKMFNKKMKSPAQVEKEIGKTAFAAHSKLVNKGEPKMQLVSDADARPAQLPVSEKFDEVEI